MADKKLVKMTNEDVLNQLAEEMGSEADAHLEVLSAIEDRLAALACYKRAELILRWCEVNRPDSGIPITMAERTEFSLLMKQAAPYTIPAERLQDPEKPDEPPVEGTPA